MPTTTYPYIILSNSNSSLTKRFKVISGGYNVVKEKGQSIKKTLDGHLDVSQGAIFDRHEYVIRTKEQEADGSEYGTFGDLETFFSLNDPNATPSNVISFTDHYGVTRNIVMGQDLARQPLGAMIAGVDSGFLTKVTMIVLP